jgi:hypothetical protein
MSQPEPSPLYCVYRAGDAPIVCYRSVRSNPADVGDFISNADAGANFLWTEMHRATGISCWLTLEKCRALAIKRGDPFVAELDLSRADPAMPWAQTGPKQHVTIWAPAAALLQAVVRYVDMGGK